MNAQEKLRFATVAGIRPVARSLIAVSALAVTVAACKHDSRPEVAGWTLIDHAQRHPIVVSQQPSTLAIKVARGSQGLSPHQRAQVIGFVEKYRATDAGNSRLVISAPSGSANEVASMQAVAEIRHIMREAGFDDASIMVEAVGGDRDAQPPVRVSYLRYVAQAPECGTWPTNLADDRRNLPYPNFGCATQRNFASQIANPADLLGPRTETARSGERRTVTWDKFTKGESTVAKKQADEKVQVKGAD